MTEPRPERWDIWHAQWYRDEARGDRDKVRPVLVLGAVPDGYLCMKITTQPKADLLQLSLLESDHGFETTGLSESGFLMPQDRLVLAVFDFKGSGPIGYLDETYQPRLAELLQI